MGKSISFGRPQIDDDTIKAVTDVLRSGTLVHGPVTESFEKEFAARAGTAHAIAVSSCTAGLHLSLFAHNIGPGDEVIVPALSHVATAHAAEYVGARPVFVDVEADTGNIDAALVASALSNKTRAAMVVHFLGLPADMDQLVTLTQKNNAILVEDCAIALDATYGNKKVGTFGKTGCYSFYPIKHITSIEGGMITTEDTALANKLRAIKAFGYDKSPDKRTKPGIYDVNALGFNYRMSEVEAAVGLTQLQKLDGFQKQRADNYRTLRQALSACEELTVFAPEKGKAKSSHYCLNAILPRGPKFDRDKIVECLRAEGIGTSVHYPSAIPLFTYYKEKYGYREGQFPNAEWMAAKTISLPVGPHINEDDCYLIADKMKEALNKNRG
jgi:perosamine synthetase